MNCFSSIKSGRRFDNDWKSGQLELSRIGLPVSRIVHNVDTCCGARSFSRHYNDSFTTHQGENLPSVELYPAAIMVFGRMDG